MAADVYQEGDVKKLTSLPQMSQVKSECTQWDERRAPFKQAIRGGGKYGQLAKSEEGAQHWAPSATDMCGSGNSRIVLS